MIEFQKIMIGLDMAGCPNRCKHCWLGIESNGNLTNDDLNYVAGEFSKYTDTLEVYSWYREPDYKSNYKELWELDKALSKNSLPQRYELLSFWRINRDEDYVKWAYELGVRICQLTFFGLEEKTDYYVGRKGAFKELLKATEILLSQGIAPRWQVFVNQDNLNEIQALIDLSHKLNLVERCLELGQEFKLFIHQGSCDGENEKLYDIRITESDRASIPSQYSLDLGEPEGRLYHELIHEHSILNLVSTNPVFYINKHFDVYPNISNIAPWWCLGNLKKDGVEVVLNNYLNNRSIAQNARMTVPLSEMVKSCGDPNSFRLFDKEDYISYILNQYCKKLIE